MTDIKQAIELLERMTAEPAPGEDARLDADELDAVLLSLRLLKVDPNDIYYLCDRKKCGKNHNCYACNHTTDIRHAVNFDLVELPRSAFIERARPRGEWIFEKANNERTDGYICSICGRAYHTKVPYFSEYKYCPNCGALMTSEVTT